MGSVKITPRGRDTLGLIGLADNRMLADSVLLSNVTMGELRGALAEARAEAVALPAEPEVPTEIPQHAPPTALERELGVTDENLDERYRAALRNATILNAKVERRRYADLRRQVNLLMEAMVRTGRWSISDAETDLRPVFDGIARLARITEKKSRHV
jgi:hypothetical protein